MEIKPCFNTMLYYGSGIKLAFVVFMILGWKLMLQIGLEIVLGLVFTTIFEWINTPIRKNTIQNRAFFIDNTPYNTTKNEELQLNFYALMRWISTT